MKRKEILKERRNINVFNCAATFYSLQALKALLIQNKNLCSYKHSHARLIKDMQEFEDELSKYLARILYDYMVIVCYGEFTHCSHASKIKYMNAGFNVNDRGIERDKKYQNAVNYNPKSILELCVKSFNNYWVSGYGGYKWMMIAKHALKYGKIDNVIFCDTAFSLSHNSNPFIDKSGTGIFYPCKDIRRYKDMLDVKFEESPINVLDFFAGSFDYNIYKFIERMKNLELFDYNQYSIRYTYNIMKDIKDYVPVQFGTKEFKKIKPIYSGAKNTKESVFLDKIEKGQPCILLLEDNDTFYDGGYFESFKGKNNNFSNLRVENINYRSGYIRIINIVTEESLEINFAHVAVLNKNYKTITYNKNKIRKRLSVC